MVRETKKLHLIEEILKIENESILDEVEMLLMKGPREIIGRSSFKNFAGMMSDKEVNDLENIINEGCFPDQNLLHYPIQ